MSFLNLRNKFSSCYADDFSVTLLNDYVVVFSNKVFVFVKINYPPKLNSKQNKHFLNYMHSNQQNPFKKSQNLKQELNKFDMKKSDKGQDCYTFKKHNSASETIKSFKSNSSKSVNFVPKHQLVTKDELSILSNFLINNKQILVITGAGVSTESGIPDYRSEGVGLFARSNTRPVQYQEFLKYPKIRQRYWARNFVGWPNFSSVEPNHNHIILKKLEDVQKVQRIITQNVDNLHGKAGSKGVIELHGTAFRVICLSCDYYISRHQFQQMLSDTNKEIVVAPQSIRPDGDIDLPQEFVEDFQTPCCPKCGGVLKPDIIFFGDNVPKIRVDEINDEVAKCDAVLVLGSSLSTYSGYRIILRARELDKPVGIINIGATRADDLAHFKISVKCSDVLLQYVILSGILKNSQQ